MEAGALGCGPPQWARLGPYSLQSQLKEWEDTEEQMGQTRRQTRSLRNTLRGQGNPHSR